MYKRGSLLVLLILGTLLLDAECGKSPAKRRSIPEDKQSLKEEVDTDPKKTVAVNLDSTVEEIDDGNATSATFSITVSSDDLENSEDDQHLSVVPKPRPGLAYFTQLQSLLSQFMTFIGIRSQVERKHRGLDFDSVETNDVGSFKDGLKTTLGAAMGQRECFKKVTCRAGKYLKTIKGKELVIVILEKLTPSTWLESVRMLKDSAIHDDKCEYKCLD